LAKNKAKQYIYIIQALLEPSKCKIGKTNDLERRKESKKDRKKERKKGRKKEGKEGRKEGRKKKRKKNIHQQPIIL
jgi:hypothetical protein